MTKKSYFVYILTNYTNTTLYIGVTNNLDRRLFEHRNHLLKGFTDKYNLSKLIYFEECSDVNEAIAREKQLKNWHREWKLNLVRSINPELKDLLDPETSSG